MVDEQNRQFDKVAEQSGVQVKLLLERVNPVAQAWHVLILAHVAQNYIWQTVDEHILFDRSNPIKQL